MKKSITVLLFLLCIPLFSFGQKDSTFVGKWKIIIDAGNKISTPSYMLLKADSTFISGSDSSFTDLKQKAADGKWTVTKNGDLKLIPSDTSRDIHYYKHVSGWKYKYFENEKKGIKSPVIMLEMDIYMEKLIYTPKGKGKKKNRH